MSTAVSAMRWAVAVGEVRETVCERAEAMVGIAYVLNIVSILVS